MFKTMKTLKLVAYDFRGKYHNTDKSYEELATLKTREMHLSNWWYLHGKLEEIVGYDKAMMLNVDELPHKTVPSIVYDECVILEDGIYPVEIIGIDEPCVGYFWTVIEKDYLYPNKNSSVQQRGLVCLKSDIEACKFARMEYTERSNHL